MYMYNDILPNSGGTQIALDSIKLVAEFFAQHPEGVHPDIAQGAVLNPLLSGSEGGRFTELTGSAGDLAIIHPYMMCAHTTTHPVLPCAKAWGASPKIV